jgi:carbon monoxide dehydrogenase subunit G
LIESRLQLEFHGAPEIEAPIDHVWKRLIDVEFVASCAIEVDEVETIDPSHFRVVNIVRFGILRFRFRVDVDLHDLDPGHSASMTARGRAPGAKVVVNTSIRLQALDDGRTRLQWKAVTDIEGAIAKIGARLLEKEGRDTIEEFWTEFATRTAV